eukprot:TRINITY_DN1215_c0_g3_i2.p1 TRINITY_DN1215_c0_g3~~TRINITY_DN1215_c0_g3_i2.p1  ORF type:complete len:633 (+),score=158.84 TRINITY_DN1215_c0_g3_i2:845-2743(+)
MRHMVQELGQMVQRAEQSTVDQTLDSSIASALQQPHYAVKRLDYSAVEQASSLDLGTPGADPQPRPSGAAAGPAAAGPQGDGAAAPPRPEPNGGPAAARPPAPPPDGSVEGALRRARAADAAFELRRFGGPAGPPHPQQQRGASRSPPGPGAAQQNGGARHLPLAESPGEPPSPPNDTAESLLRHMADSRLSRISRDESSAGDAQQTSGSSLVELAARAAAPPPRPAPPAQPERRPTQRLPAEPSPLPMHLPGLPPALPAPGDSPSPSPAMRPDRPSAGGSPAVPPQESPPPRHRPSPLDVLSPSSGPHQSQSPLFQRELSGDSPRRMVAKGSPAQISRFNDEGVAFAVRESTSPAQRAARGSSAEFSPRGVRSPRRALVSPTHSSSVPDDSPLRGGWAAHPPKQPPAPHEEEEPPPPPPPEAAGSSQGGDGWDEPDPATAARAASDGAWLREAARLWAQAARAAPQGEVRDTPGEIAAQTRELLQGASAAGRAELQAEPDAEMRELLAECVAEAACLERERWELRRRLPGSHRYCRMPLRSLQDQLRPAALAAGALADAVEKQCAAWAEALPARPLALHATAVAECTHHARLWELTSPGLCTEVVHRWADTFLDSLLDEVAAEFDALAPER